MGSCHSTHYRPLPWSREQVTILNPAFPLGHRCGPYSVNGSTWTMPPDADAVEKKLRLGPWDHQAG